VSSDPKAPVDLSAFPAAFAAVMEGIAAFGSQMVESLRPVFASLSCPEIVQVALQYEQAAQQQAAELAHRSTDDEA
jgi:hypothetical protein